MADWITWFIAFVQTTVQWLSGTLILGVPLSALLVSFILLGLFVRVFLYKP